MRVSLWLTLCVLLASCSRTPEKTLTVAVNAGVEGTALKLAAREWGAARGVHVEVVELPYANLFEFRDPFTYKLGDPVNLNDATGLAPTPTCGQVSMIDLNYGGGA